MTIFENIPEELKGLRQWVCAVDGSKVPLNAQTGYPASASDPKSWSDFKTAMYGVTDEDADNIGFVFRENGGIVGIDLDEGVWDEYGLMTSRCAELIGRCDSYTEKSRSGRGIHILLKGKLPFSGRNNRNGVEIYQSNRYFIVTGDRIHGEEITENQDAIDWVLDTYFAEVMKESTGSGRVIGYAPKWHKPKSGKFPLRPEYPKIASGSRNMCLASVAGALHTMGYPPHAILNELVVVNDCACRPKLSMNEIRQIASSITRYKR